MLHNYRKTFIGTVIKDTERFLAGQGDEMFTQAFRRDGDAAGKIARIRKVVFGEKHMLGGVRTILADRLDEDAT